MLRALTFILITLFFVRCVSVNPLKDVLHGQDRDRHIKYFPPGTVWVSDSLFIDQAEMSNYGYEQFKEYVLLNFGKDSVAHLMQDTTAWDNLSEFYQRYNSESKPYIDYYHKLMRFWNYPVVGLDHQQAEAYCKWREYMVNRGIYAFIHKVNYLKIDSIPLMNIPTYVEFRLPDKDEWEKAAYGGLTPERFPLGCRSMIVGKNDPVTNTLESVNLQFMGFREQYGFYVNPIIGKVFDGWPNEYYLYNMLGNVSELVEDDLVKGLNFTMTLNGMRTTDFAVSIESDNDYDGTYSLETDYLFFAPSALIGFRCAAIVHYSNFPDDFDFKKYLKSME